MLTQDEVAALFQFLNGEMALLAKLLYGTGMRLMEGLRLRVNDVDFDRHAIIVRLLRLQLLRARALWELDRQMGRGGVQTPHALDQKYPNVGHSWGWFWVFPSPTLSVDPASGVVRRHHLFEER